MSVFVYDCALGHLIFEVLDTNALLQLACSDVVDCTVDKLKQVLWLMEIVQFEEPEIGRCCTALSEGTMPRSLKHWIKSSMRDNKLESTQMFVSNEGLSESIKEKFPSVICSVPSFINRLQRLIRVNLEHFLLMSRKELREKIDRASECMTKLRLQSNTQVDDMRIIQAVSLLDSLNKELGSHVAEIKARYSLHFPELSKIIADDFGYCKFVTIVGDKANVKHNAPMLISTFGVELERMLREASVLPSGQPFSLDDEKDRAIMESAEQVVETYDYRNQLTKFLKEQMNRTAPNLSHLVGESVGSRLIARAGSLEALSKMSSSEIQLAGAEKALKTARSSDGRTPKHGYIFFAPICLNADPKDRGKLARTLASKIALSCRVDALGEYRNANLGIKYLSDLEKRFLKKTPNKIHRLNQVVDAAKLSMLNSQEKIVLKRMNIEYDEPEGPVSYFKWNHSRGCKARRH